MRKTGNEIGAVSPAPIRVSMIIPAKNEERCLTQTLRALRSIKAEEYPHLEIVVGVGASNDRTHEIARTYADRVVDVGEGPSRARNEAARCASGDVFVFLDADAVPLAGAIDRIVHALGAEGHVVGTCAMYPDVLNWKSLALAKMKNVVRRWLHRGCSELIFCDRQLFVDEGIQFDERMRMGELSDFFKRAMNNAGARYEYVREMQYQFSVRRYEEMGYVRVMLHWMGWTLTRRFTWIRQRLESTYWNVEYRTRSATNRSASK